MKMGQAKRRGTFEERKSESINKNGIRMPKINLKNLIRDLAHPMSLFALMAMNNKRKIK